MSPRIRISAALCLLALAATACGGSPQRSATGPSPTVDSASPAPGSSSRPPEPDTADHEHGPSGDPDAAQHLTNKYSPKKRPAPTYRKADSGDQATGSGRIQLKLEITPPCVEPGQILTVSARTKPDVQVSFLTNLPANDKGQGQQKDGRSGSDGIYTWTVKVLPNTYPRNYTMFGAAADDKGEDGGRSGTWFFVVAAKGGC